MNHFAIHHKLTQHCKSTTVKTLLEKTKAKQSDEQRAENQELER